LFSIILALAAYLRVLLLSSKLDSAGLMQAIIVVRELPPKLSVSIRVSLESRYGMCLDLLTSELITFPRVWRPLLIEIPSLAVLPVAPVFFILSLPAKSTKWNFEFSYSSELFSSASREMTPSSPSFKSLI